MAKQCLVQLYQIERMHCENKHLPKYYLILMSPKILQNVDMKTTVHLKLSTFIFILKYMTALLEYLDLVVIVVYTVAVSPLFAVQCIANF